jgi:hypothetical protein
VFITAAGSGQGDRLAVGRAVQHLSDLAGEGGDDIQPGVSRKQLAFGLQPPQTPRRRII